MTTKLYCHNGLYLWDKGNPQLTLRTVRDTYDEDTIHSHLPIPAETELEVVNCYQNLYGTFIDVVYNGRTYSIKPKHVEVISSQGKEM